MAEHFYPEHEKLQAISEQSQACYDFIEWLGEREIVLCSIPLEFTDTWLPIHTSMATLLAEHFGIDLAKIEAEKRAMIDALQEASNG